jgi:hypothetical protein
MRSSKILTELSLAFPMMLQLQEISDNFTAYKVINDG